MRRWFRRKGKDTDQDGENGTAPLAEDTEPGPEATAASEVTGEEALAESEPEAWKRAGPNRDRFSPQRAVFFAAGAGSGRGRARRL
jgi:hypothetical protein